MYFSITGQQKTNFKGNEKIFIKNKHLIKFLDSFFKFKSGIFDPQKK